MPGTGSVVGGGQQNSLVLPNIQKAQTTNAAGSNFDGTGYRTVYMEVVEGNVGTATLTIEGSFDQTNWFTLWAAPTGANGRTYAATFSVTQNSRTWIVLQDTAPFIRARTSANTGSVTVNVFGNPV